jgi:hypothetical protein
MVRLDSGPGSLSTKDLFINHSARHAARGSERSADAQAVGIPSGIGQKVVLVETLAGVRLRDGDRVLSPPVKGYEYTFREDELALGNAPALRTWWHYG